MTKWLRFSCSYSYSYSISYSLLFIFIFTIPFNIQLSFLQFIVSISYSIHIHILFCLHHFSCSYSLFPKALRAGFSFRFPFRGPGVGPRPHPCRRPTGRPKVGIPFETSEHFSCSTGCLELCCSGRFLGGPKVGPDGVQMSPEMGLREFQGSQSGPRWGPNDKVASVRFVSQRFMEVFGSGGSGSQLSA